MGKLCMFKMISASWGSFRGMYVGVPTEPPQGARWLTSRPADPLGLGRQRGGGEGVPPPPPTTPKTAAHPSGSHIGRQQPPRKPGV